MICPCKGCKERNEHCHADCERYLAFAAECEMLRKERGRNANVRDYFGQRKVKVARIFKRKLYGTHKGNG